VSSETERPANTGQGNPVRGGSALGGAIYNDASAAITDGIIIFFSQARGPVSALGGGIFNSATDSPKPSPTPCPHRVQRRHHQRRQYRAVS